MTFLLSSALRRWRPPNRFLSTESMGENVCHYLLGVKIRLGDLPSGLAMPPVVSVYDFKGIGCFLK